MSTKIRPAQRRYDAIHAVMTGARHVEFEPEHRIVWDRPFDAREAVAADIRGMAALGRTGRWQDAVEAWAVMVEQAEDERRYQWAFDQFGIYAAHAAE